MSDLNLSSSSQTAIKYRLFIIQSKENAFVFKTFSEAYFWFF